MNPISFDMTEPEGFSYPTLSIVVPVDRRTHLLQKLVQSIGPLPDDVELIFVVDLRLLARRRFRLEVEEVPPFVRFEYCWSSRAGRKRNLGLGKATGRYIWFVDSDDELLEGAISKVLDSVRAEDADTHIFDWELRNLRTGETKLIRSQVPFDSKRKRFAPEDAREQLFQITTPSAWNLIFKTSFLRENALFFSSQKITNDLSFTLSSLAFAHELVIHNAAIYRYNQWSPGSSQSKADYASVPKALCELQASLVRRGTFGRYEETFLKLANYQLIFWVTRGSSRVRFLVVTRFFSKLASTCLNPEELASLSEEVSATKSSNFRGRKNS